MRLAAPVLDGDLRLAVGPQVGQRPVLAHLGEPAREAVRERDRERHQLGRLAAREPEHHPLVAGALVVAVARAARLERLVDAALDVGALLVDRDERAARAVVEAVARVGVADLADRVADDVLELDVRGRRDLAQDDDRAGRGGRLAGDAGGGVVAQDRVEDRVRDLVTHLVGVAFGHRFGREQVLLGLDDAGHGSSARGFEGSPEVTPVGEEGSCSTIRGCTR